MDERGAGFTLQAPCLLIGIIIDRSVENHRRPKFPRGLYLGQRCTAGHDNGCRHAKLARCQGNPLRMVSGRACNHARRSFRLAETGNLDVGTADLERARVLEILRLKKDAGTILFKCPKFHETGTLDDSLEAFAGLKNHPKCYTFHSLPLKSAGLPVHILDNDIIDFSQRGAILQHLPGLIRMIVDLDHILITDGQQAVPVKIVYEIIIDFILIKVFAVNEELCIIPVLKHTFFSFQLLRIQFEPSAR